MQIHMVSQIGTWDQFLHLFRDGDEAMKYSGLPLISHAAANINSEDRYKICDFLLDRNVDVTALNREGQSVLHILLGHVEHDIPVLTVYANG